MEASFLLPTLLLSLASSPFSAFFFPRLLFVFESNMLEMEEKEKRNGSTSLLPALHRPEEFVQGPS